jgi:hypothetical protein
MIEYLGKTVLVSIGKNDAARQSIVSSISPNGLYVLFASHKTMHEYLGWALISDVKILDSWDD